MDVEQDEEALGLLSFNYSIDARRLILIDSSPGKLHPLRGSKVPKEAIYSGAASGNPPS